LATDLGIGTRAAGLHRSKPSSTAAANAARSTARQIWIERHDSSQPVAMFSNQPATSSRSSRSSLIAPSPASMCGIAHSYCSFAFSVTSEREAT
jgi:hypothetical protein